MTNKVRKLLALDLSLSCTGFSLFDIDSQKLLSYGTLSPSKKGLSKIEYPEQQVIRMRDLANQVLELIDGSVEIVILEEVNRGISRLGQKTLCGTHFVLYDRMQDLIKKVILIDSDGRQGWRSASGLKLQLSESDRLQNKEVRKMNRKMKKGKKIPVIDVKQLAVNYVNEKYKLNFTIDDNDICDSIGLGTYYLLNVLGKPNETLRSSHV